MPAHQSITDATKIHEAKQIASATTADAGKVITPSSSTNGEGTLRKIVVDELDPAGRTPWTGWAQYADSLYTSSAKRAITASTRTKVTIDGAGAKTDTSGLPTGVSALWDTTNNIITPAAVGDAYNILLNFKGAPDTTDTTGAYRYVDMELDIGGGAGVIVSDARVFIKDTATMQFAFAFPEFANATFLANGGSFYLTPSANASFWDFEVLIVRTHRGA